MFKNNKCIINKFYCASVEEILTWVNWDMKNYYYWKILWHQRCERLIWYQPIFFFSLGGLTFWVISSTWHAPTPYVAWKSQQWWGEKCDANASHSLAKHKKDWSWQFSKIGPCLHTCSVVLGLINKLIQNWS